MTTIKLKNGSGAPTAGDLAQGEPALDLTNKRLYTEDSGGTVIEVGTNPGVDVTFADNRKAVFGADSDLQIYHDGSNSYVTDAGTGDLRIRGANVEIQTGSGNKYFQGAANVASLYHTNNLKLATTATGIDVTGTIVSDGLTVDGSTTITTADNTAQLTLVSTDTDALVGPQLNLWRNSGTGTNGDLIGEVTFTGEDTVGSTNTFATISAIAEQTNNGSEDGSLHFKTLLNGTLAKRLSIGAGSTGGDISFYEDTGTTAKFFWDASAESLGIGTSSPSTKGHFFSGTSMEQLTVDGTGAIETGINFANGGTTYGQIYFNNVSPYDMSVFQQYSTGSLIFGTNDTERMRIDSSGNVGIGTSNPAQALVVSRSSGNTYLDVSRATQSQGQVAVQLTGGTGGTNWIMYQDTSSDDLRFFGNSATRMTIDSSGNVGIGTTNPSTHLHVQGSSGEIRVQDTGSGGGIVSFRDSGTSSIPSIQSSGNNLLVNTGGTERMRIDSSGNLLVGTTDTVIWNDTSGEGVVIGPNAIQVARASDTCLLLNRQSTDGILQVFASRGVQVGSVSVTTTATTYNTSSDQRLKDNIVDAPSASNDIDAIQVRSFDWKADGSHQKYGMVAQELQSVAPEAVSQGETEEDMMGVDYSKLVPMLVKEIQSLRARVAQLEGEN